MSEQMLAHVGRVAFRVVRREADVFVEVEGAEAGNVQSSCTRLRDKPRVQRLHRAAGGKTERDFRVVSDLLNHKFADIFGDGRRIWEYLEHVSQVRSAYAARGDHQSPWPPGS